MSKLRTKSLKTPSKAKTISAISLLALGLILMPTGFVLSDIIQGEIDNGIADQVSVPSKHSSAFDDWITNDYKGAPEMYATFYLWNLTNSDKFIGDGDKPVYEEIGPFTFRRFDYKYDIDFSDDNDEVSYKEYHKYIQVYGDDIAEVKITNINPGFLGAIEKAGGTTLEYSKFVLPLVLTDVREVFVEKYLEALPDSINYDPLVHIGFDHGYIPPGANEIDQSALESPYNDPVLYNFTNALPAVSVFYEKWANDYFPDTGLMAPFDNLTEIIDVHFDILSAYLFGIYFDTPQYAGNHAVNLDASASGVGVDIDGMPPYNYPGSETDLNISTHKLAESFVPNFPPHKYVINVGGSNITQEQCSALWDESNPNSLTGFDYEKNKVWFNALDGDIESRQFLNDTFGLNDAQLDLILDWINVSVHTWSKNVFKYTIESWNSGFVVTRTAEEWLFTANDTAIYEYEEYYGYEDDLELIGFFDNCHNTAEAEESKVPKFTIKTGRDDVSEVGQVVEFNGEDEIYIWAKPIEIEGTRGTQFAPDVSEEDDLDVFNDRMMRVVKLEYDEPAEIYDIDLLQFKMAEDTFSPDPLYFQNIEGIVNLASVERYHKAPVRVSKPHFLGAEAYIQTNVKGMSPSSNIHDTYVRVEPITGIVMDAAVRAQVNFEVNPDSLLFPNISNKIMPVVWFEESGKITEELAEEFKDQLYSALELKQNVPLFSLTIGAALCVPGAALLTSQSIKRRKIERAGLVKKKYSKLLQRKGIDKKDKILESIEKSTLKSDTDT